MSPAPPSRDDFGDRTGGSAGDPGHGALGPAPSAVRLAKPASIARSRDGACHGTGPPLAPAAAPPPGGMLTNVACRQAVVAGAVLGALVVGIAGLGLGQWALVAGALAGGALYAAIACARQRRR